MDTSPVERERRKSIDTSLFHFSTDKYTFTIMDTPGDVQYAKNMIAATCLADAGIHIVNASD